MPKESFKGDSLLDKFFNENVPAKRLDKEFEALWESIKESPEK